MLTDQFATKLRTPSEPHVEYRVVHHGPGDIVGVPDDGSKTITLSKTDVLIYRLDHKRILRDTAAALGFEAAEEGIAGVPFTFRMGTFKPLAGFSFPAYVAFALEPTDVRRAIEYVAALSTKPFVFFAPTGRFMNAACESLLQNHNACFLSLSDALKIDPNGSLLATPVAMQKLAAFQDAVLPSSTTSNGVVFFSTPSNATWADLRIKFIDGHTVSVSIRGDSGTYVYSQLGMVDSRSGKPTVGWELLRSFAGGQGLLTWKSADAKRENQKRCENLTKDLQRFFRIEGKPIEYLKSAKGWRTRFSIEPDA